MKSFGLKRYTKIWLIGLIILLTPSCIEEFEPGSVKFEKLLVVDGNISDQAKVHEIRLSFTSPINAEDDQPNEVLSGATVWVEDGAGNRLDYTEQDAGTYASPVFAAVAGRSYSLNITTAEGKSYQSAPEELTPAPEVTNIYDRFKVETGDGESTSIPGIQFFIDVDNADQGSQFYRYEWTDTHQVIVPHIKLYDYVFNQDGTAEVIPFSEDVKECYREGRFNELILATSTTSDNGQLKEVPVSFISATRFDVTTMYSLEVTQRSISPEAYSYYRKLELFNESNGSLFDKQQGVLVGNVKSLDSPEEEVLGYFEVSGANSKRVFINPSDFNEEVQQYIRRPCSEYRQYNFEGSVSAFYQALDVDPENRGRESAIRSLYEIYDYNSFAGVISMAHRLCVDCRYRGSVGKPDYWP
ncbi:MAG: DUF4249 domain-containing protein [Cytophagia bacterium]|nr:DUF4249 domain-containing protein [Cytophagia bacterium]